MRVTENGLEFSAVKNRKGVAIIPEFYREVVNLVEEKFNLKFSTVEGNDKTVTFLADVPLTEEQAEEIHEFLANRTLTSG